MVRTTRRRASAKRTRATRTVTRPRKKDRKRSRVLSRKADVVEPRSLNPGQDQAASVVDGPALVIAGAGTGKTLTLVHRLVRLVESGVPPESILLLTFTRRAAQEMIERASRLAGKKGETVAGGTFHSFANLMLRRYGSTIGIRNDYAVLDQADTFEILSGIRSDLDLSKKARRFPQRVTIAAVISKATNKKTSIKKVLEAEYAQFVHEVAELGKIAKLYKHYKSERNLLDFDDLLVYLIALLEKSPETRAKIVERYRYVMVDEYQDTNILQARITELLTGETKNIMVVGDDAQSVYAFRGACHKNLFAFHKAFRTAQLVTLEQNYRSTQPVLEVANALMEQMSKSFRKELFTERKDGEKPVLVEAKDEEEQARFVANKVWQLHEQGTCLSEIGVLFRAGTHAFSLELELQSQGVPYVKYGGFRFMEAAHIKDVLAHLRVLANPADDLSLMRALMLCDGIGRAGARKIQQALDGQSVANGLMAFPVKGKSEKSVARLGDLMAALEKVAHSPARRLELTVEYYAPILQQRFDDWPRRQRDLEQLLALCQKYRSLESMLTDLTLEPPTHSRADRLAGPVQEEQLVLSTMHSAKGLEWKVVFIIQAIDGCIPMVYFDDDDDQEKLDEELRLLYVAATRAKDTLYIVHPRETARGYGYGWAEVSRFLGDVPERLFDAQRASELLGAMPGRPSKRNKRARARR